MGAARLRAGTLSAVLSYPSLDVCVNHAGGEDRRQCEERSPFGFAPADMFARAPRFVCANSQADGAAEVPVSDRRTFEGLTQFTRRALLARP